MGVGKIQLPPMVMAESAVAAPKVTGAGKPAVVKLGVAIWGGKISDDEERAGDAGSPDGSEASWPRERRGPEGRLIDVFAIKL